MGNFSWVTFMCISNKYWWHLDVTYDLTTCTVTCKTYCKTLPHVPSSARPMFSSPSDKQDTQGGRDTKCDLTQIHKNMITTYSILHCMNWALESRSQVQGIHFWLSSILHCMNLYELSPGIQVSSSRYTFLVNFYITNLYELSPGIQVSSSIQGVQCTFLVKFYITLYELSPGIQVSSSLRSNQKVFMGYVHYICMSKQTYWWLKIC